MNTVPFCEALMLVLAGVTPEVEDARKNYGETRIICYGLLEGRMAVVGYTPRGASTHLRMRPECR